MNSLYDFITHKPIILYLQIQNKCYLLCRHYRYLSVIYRFTLIAATFLERYKTLKEKSLRKSKITN